MVAKLLTNTSNKITRFAKRQYFPDRSNFTKKIIPSQIRQAL